jgi:hypothetical protein
MESKHAHIIHMVNQLTYPTVYEKGVQVSTYLTHSSESSNKAISCYNGYKTPSF